jgi:hypothetical protein
VDHAVVALDGTVAVTASVRSWTAGKNPVSRFPESESGPSVLGQLAKDATGERVLADDLLIVAGKTDLAERFPAHLH